MPHEINQEVLLHRPIVLSQDHSYAGRKVQDLSFGRSCAITLLTRGTAQEAKTEQPSSVQPERPRQSGNPVHTIQGGTTQHG